jgi:hypothetical protein
MFPASVSCGMVSSEPLIAELFFFTASQTGGDYTADLFVLAGLWFFSAHD